MRRFFSLSLVAIAATMAMAAPISKQQALAVAQQVMQHHGGDITLRQASARITATNGTELLYVFNSARDGWVMVAGDDQAIPVLGYSDHGTLDLSQAPDNLLAWIEYTKHYVQQCAAAPSGTHAARIGTPVQSPLLGNINWGQGAPFNLLCPIYQSGGQTLNYYVGCVATAATQIMKLHNYPPRGNGSKTYTANGITLTADFGATTYDWDLMLPDYSVTTATTQQQNAVATLAAHFGIAVEMEYAPAGSGALSQLVPAALRDYFGYDSAVTMHKRDYYSTSEWLQLIKDEIDAGRAVFYGASSDVSNSGHAFVCDGYDTEDYVHINWGWTGTSNGYFLVSHLDPSTLGIGGGTGGYNLDQEIITGIQPPTGLGTAPLRPLYNPMSMRLYTQTTSDFGIITSVENHDTRPFNGDLAIVAVRDGEILAVLKTFTAAIDAFAGGHSGMLAMKTIDGISKNVGNVPDGPCTIRLAFREDASCPWNIMRYCRGRDSKGLPYIGQFAATISAGKLGNIDGSCQVPDVTLLSPLMPDGEVYAQGSANFNISLRNNSGDVRLKNIVIRFTSADDPSVFFDYENAVNCYDEVIENLNLLVNLDENMPQGQYMLTAYEKGFPDHPFEQAQPAQPITVLAPATMPVMRLTQQVMWQMPGEDQVINQGDNIYFALNSRN
ncbi:MAG: C10 family peptidase [Muribaculaceae bacterium]|nr:C10 family peptidase [Muribaculaceae bacterium]